MPTLPTSNVQEDTEGRWFDYAAGIQVRIARMGNPAFNAHLRRLAKQKARGKTQEQMAKEAAAHTIVKDWKGITETDDEGSPEIPYSAAQCLKYFNDPAYYDFYRWVNTVSGDDDEWGIEAEAGNSSPSSSGT